MVVAAMSWAPLPATAFMSPPSVPAIPRTLATRVIGRRYVASKISAGAGIKSSSKANGMSSSSAGSPAGNSHHKNNKHPNHHAHSPHSHTAAASPAALQPPKSLMTASSLGSQQASVDTSRSKNTITRAVASTASAGGYVPNSIAPPQPQVSPPAPQAPLTSDAIPPDVLWGESGRMASSGSVGGVELPVDEEHRAALLAEAYAECQRITSIYAKTFYMGTSFLDYAKRSATWAIYVWCRRTDDIVDSPRAIVENTMDADLEQWSKRLDDVWEDRPWDSLDATLCDVRTRYPGMSIEPYRDMIKGMVMDVPGLGQHRYATFEELYLYCYRVAGTVGLMTLPIMGTAPGYSLKQATEPALALGIALQLTNILRDVGEDAMRGRIYLPLEDLARFSVTEDQIMNKIMNSNYRELIKFQIARARVYFDRAEEGIPMLSPDARLPVRSSLDMYREILNRIEDNDYDNFRHRAYVSKFEKLLILPLSWMKTLDWGRRR